MNMVQSIAGVIFLSFKEKKWYSKSKWWNLEIITLDLLELRKRY